MNDTFNKCLVFVFSFFVFVSFNQNTHAGGFLVEPVLGYSVGGHEVSNNDTSYNGVSLGARLGYQFLGLQGGFDYLQSNLSMKDVDSLTAREMGLFVGYEFPILLRAYAGYIFSSTAKKEASIDQEYTKGSGTKFGVGFTGLPFIDINFEYRMGDFTELKTNGSTSSTDVTNKAFMISLSLPFVL